MLRRNPHREGSVQPSNSVWLIKYWMPFILFASTFGILTDGFHSLSHVKVRFLGELPFILLGVFFLSTAELRRKEKSWEYRRFVTWSRIPSNEILGITRSVFGGLGYVRLNHFVAPWGKLYFVASPREGRPRNDAEAQAHEDATPSTTNEGKNQSATLQRNLRICGLLCLAGVLWCLVLSIWSPGIYAPENFDNFPVWVAFSMKALLLSVSWPWVLITAALFVAQILGQRFGKQAWVSAFIVGNLVMHMIIETSR